ncbi:MAG TPA: acyl-CoA carboxylase subunit epsilon [Trebonia sp.]
MADSASDSVPFLRVVRGDASPEEIAALVAALQVIAVSAASVPAAEEPPIVRHWNDRSRLLRPVIHPGPGAWRRSALP